MSAGDLWRRVTDAWAMLGGKARYAVAPGRARAPVPPEPADVPDLGQDGFAEEALPWMDAVYAFSLRLTGGDRDAADDLVQETFLSAYRSWRTFQRGSNARSWLFTICRNAHLKARDRGPAKREIPVSVLGADGEPPGDVDAFAGTSPDPEAAFFHQIVDDEVVRAIDALPEDFREVLVLSDLGELKYGEIAQILELPVGTVKSRLFRARRLLQERLIAYAREAGVFERGPTGPGEVG